MEKKEIQKVWIDNYDIHSYEVDVTGKCSIQFLCRFMQESAWHHAENLGVGFSHLLENNFFWVLTSQYIKINEYPKWGEKIQIHTWPTGKDRLAYIRDFKILDKQKEVIAVAITKWYALDFDRKRPQNIDDIYDFRPEVAERAIKIELGKLASANADLPIKSIQVGFSDLDVNDHANNVRYIDWMVECFDLDFHKSFHLSELQISYLNEALYNDKISVYQQTETAGEYLHSIKRVADDKELCRIKTNWTSQI